MSENGKKKLYNKKHVISKGEASTSVQNDFKMIFKMLETNRYAYFAM